MVLQYMTVLFELLFNNFAHKLQNHDLENSIFMRNKVHTTFLFYEFLILNFESEECTVSKLQ